MKTIGKRVLSLLLALTILPVRVPAIAEELTEEPAQETDIIIESSEHEETDIPEQTDTVSEMDEIPESVGSSETAEYTEPEGESETETPALPEYLPETGEDVFAAETEETEIAEETGEMTEIIEQSEETAEETDAPENTESVGELPETGRKPDEEESVPVEYEEEEFRLMSEPLAQHVLNEDQNMLQITNVQPSGTGLITVTALWKVHAPTDVMLIAENRTDRYYLASVETPPVNVEFKFENIYPGLAEGRYTLRVATYDSSFDVPTLSVSPMYSKTLQMLPVPDVSVSAADDGNNSGAVQVKLPDMTYISRLVYRKNGSLSATIDKETLLGNAKKGVYTISGLSSDSYDFWYEGISYGDPVIVSAGSASVSLPGTTKPAVIYASVIKNGTAYGDSGKPLIMGYIGETAQISSTLTPYGDVDDTRLTYRSFDTKVVTVDALGNIKAVGKGSTQVTVSSAADSSAAASVFVKVDPITPGTFRFDQNKGISEYNQGSAVHPKRTSLTYTLLVRADQIPAGADVPVTYTVTGGDGLKIFPGSSMGDGHWPSAADDFSNYVSTWTTKMTTFDGDPRSQVHLMAVGGGHYTVTAEALGKKAVCTIDVDGFSSIYGSYAYPSEGAQFYKAGKTVTGWISWDDDHEQFIYGTGGLKPTETGLSGTWIYYADPSTKKTVDEGVRKIGDKFYYFDSSRILDLEYDAGYEKTVKGVAYAYNPNTGNHDEICVGPEGYLLTGWQYVDTNGDYTDDAMHYYDPNTGFIAKQSWVPVRSGKGETWVNGEGNALDDNGNSLDNSGAAYNDGFHLIGGDWYVFAGGYKKGARQTGWVYFAEDYMTVSDAKNGICKFYCDPNYGGRVSTDAFWVSGKEYIGISLKPGLPAGAVLIPANYGLAEAGEKNVKYLAVGSAGYIIGPDGSVVKNSLVKALDMFCSPKGIYTIYAGSDGYYVTDEWITVNKKNYHFDSSGHLSTDAEIITEYRVYDGAVNRQVAARYSEKNGYAYCISGDAAKLTDIVLYKSVSSEMVPYAVLDKNGRQVYGTVAKARPGTGESEKVYLVDESGKIICGSDDYYDTVHFKGKLYAVSRNGDTAEPGAVALGDDPHPYLGCAGKNGVLVQDAIADVTVNGTKYKVCFESGGEASSPSDAIIIAKGKAYKTATAPDLWYGQHFRYISVPEKAGWASGPDGMRVYVNKDGSLKTGLLALPEGRKAYYLIRNGFWFDTLDCWNMAPYPTLWKIGGKLYLFNENGYMVTGWVHFDQVMISDPGSGESLGSYKDAMFWFDPKTGAASAGGWITVPLPVVTGTEPAFGVEDIGIPENSGYETHPVNVSTSKGKLYFGKDGILLRNTEASVSGKLYKFAPDGQSGYKTGWTDANKIYYIVKNGQLATGRQKIDGQYYFFDASGRKAINSLIRTGKKWYFYDENGIQAAPVLNTTAAGYNLYGSPDGVKLTAVWAKDGSLAKIVYTGSQTAAAGETVNFGSYDPDWDIYSSFVLGSDGLPMTGAVYNIHEGTNRNAYLYNADGTKVRAYNDGYYSLVQNGKKYYVLNDYLIQTGSYVRALPVDGSFSSLNEADQKTMNCFMELAYNHSCDLYVLVNPDGSVASDSTVSALVDGTERVWHTNRLGIPMELYSFVYKYGGKWYADEALTDVKLYGYGSEGCWADIRTKDSGELIGFYNSETGKAISGNYSSEEWEVSLNKGKPKTGNLKFGGVPRYLDPQTGVYEFHP